MTKYIFTFYLILTFPFLVSAQDSSEVPVKPSELEQLIIDIQSKVDIEKRFDFSRANSKEKQLADLKKINIKLKKDLKSAEDLSERLINQFDQNEKTLAELEEKLKVKQDEGNTRTKTLKNQIEAIKEWLKTKKSSTEIAYRPARVLMQDFTGVPAVVDLAAMRDAIKKLGKNPDDINPLQPAELVIDHSVQVDNFWSDKAFGLNAKLEYERNYERYKFLKWGQSAFSNFKVVPPDTGIVHQINIKVSDTIENQVRLFPNEINQKVNNKFLEEE